MAEHYGYCNKCRKLAPVSHEERGNQVLLVKNCPDCGRTETIVSTDPAVWRAKRELDRLTGDSGCAMNCQTCGATHQPMTVFVDLTNRCDMDCPICIANIPGMGFKFDPPFEYFEKIFRHLAAMDPKPSIKLFGGEPTARNDLIDIVKCARDLGLSTSIVTNGLRLADEEYAKKLLATRAKIIFSFDGRDPKVYEKLRGNARYYEQKLRALENIRKHRKGKITIMCVVAVGINDHLMADLFQFCHERSDFITALEFIPLTRTWDPGTIAADGSDITAMEDAEKIVASGVPGGKLEFLPAGLMPFNTISKYLPIPRLTFAGAHPNCESVTFLVSNGERFLPVSHFIKGKSLFAAVNELINRDAEVGRKMERTRRGIFGKLGMEKMIGRARCLMAVFSTLRKNVDKKEILGKHANWKMLKIGFGLVVGRKGKDVLRANTRLQTTLRVVVLPFEEPRTLDSAKLKRCPAAFVYEDPNSRDIRTMPVCAWGLYKDDILRRIMDNYRPGEAAQQGKAGVAAQQA